MAPTKPVKPVITELPINHEFPMANGQYIGNEVKKELVFLHHTAGTTAKSAINWWNQTKDRVGVAFVIDRDGIIYQTFDPKDWAYHLGLKGDNDYVEKASIGIEIVSGGRLHLVDGKYIFYPLFPNLSGAREIPKEEVYEIEGGRWDGIWQKYTDAQVTSVIGLVKKLCTDFGIIIQPDFSEHTLEYNEDVFKKELHGLYSHSTVRKDKVDIFPQENLIKGLQSLISIPS